MTRAALKSIIYSVKKNKNTAFSEGGKTAASQSKSKIVLSVIIQYLVITLGCIFYAAGISLFVEPANLSSGGMTGISLIINAFTGFPTGYLYIILNVPMFILGLIVGGVLFGVGMGLIFRMGASTAGTDVIVKLLRKRFRHLKTGMISLVTDMVIVGCSLFIPFEGNKFDRLFYTALHVVVFTLVFDLVLYGGNSAKTVFIITAREKCENVVNRILKDVDTGATVLDAKGAYTGADKVMIMCVVKPFLYPRLRDVVHEEDKRAFMIISSAKEIYGEGYQNPEDAEL